MKQYLLGTFGYLAATFPLAYVWHLVVFKDLYDRLGIFNRAEPIVALGFLVILFQGVLLSWAFPLFRRSGSALRDGLRFGLAAGLFLWSSQVVAAAAKHTVAPISTWLLVESAYFAIQFSLIGLVFGLLAREQGKEVAHAL